jgi:uncharacterized membrane protein YbaN (DUF454 family)
VAAPDESQLNSTRAVPGEHGSPVVRAVFLGIGIAAFIGGVLGIFLPLLPATPLFILAAGCFARAYRPFHDWMLAHKVIGPMLHEWHHHRSIPHRTKLVAIVTMLASFGTSIWFVVKPLWLQVALGLFALGLATWMYRIPSRDRPQRS